MIGNTTIKHTSHVFYGSNPEKPFLSAAVIPRPREAGPPVSRKESVS